ncbi:MAG: hypothetical protein GQ536_01170 [Candidatus Aminicenantes bacterium]|nr:hypothetical protein [Candidatus Aminicenantes bacterium]
MTADVLIRNAAELVTVQAASDGPKTGAAMGELGIIKNGALAIAGGEIIAVGESSF